MIKLIYINFVFVALSCSTQNSVKQGVKVNVLNYTFDISDGYKEDCSRNSIFINCVISNNRNKDLVFYDKKIDDFICLKPIIGVSENKRFELVLVNNLQKIPKNTIDTISFLIKNFTFRGSLNQLKKEFEKEINNAKYLMISISNEQKIKICLTPNVEFLQTKENKKISKRINLDSLNPELIKDSLEIINFI